METTASQAEQARTKPGITPQEFDKNKIPPMTIHRPAATLSLSHERSTITSVPGFRHLLGQAADILRDVRNAIFDSYRPELHYMRGPGPRWRAKHRPAPLGLATADGLIA